MSKVSEQLDLVDLYVSLAEEAAELSQAAAKMARKLKGTNPTPKSTNECINNVVEEYTDVYNVAQELGLTIDWDTLLEKHARWVDRLEHRKTQPEHGTEIDSVRDYIIPDSVPIITTPSQTKHVS